DRHLRDAEIRRRLFFLRRRRSSFTRASYCIAGRLGITESSELFLLFGDLSFEHFTICAVLPALLRCRLTPFNQRIEFALHLFRFFGKSSLPQNFGGSFGLLARLTRFANGLTELFRHVRNFYFLQPVQAAFLCLRPFSFRYVFQLLDFVARFGQPRPHTLKFFFGFLCRRSRPIPPLAQGVEKVVGDLHRIRHGHREALPNSEFHL